MTARVNVARVFHYFDSDGSVADPALLTGEVQDASDDAVFTLSLTQNAVAPNLHLSAGVTFTQPGTYTVIWKYNNVVKLTEQVQVGWDPAPTFLLDVAGDLRLAYAAAETFTAQVINSAGLQVGATANAVYNANTLTYEVASYTFALEGDFFLVWLRDVGGTPTATAVQHVLILTPRARFATSFVAGSTAAKHTEAKLVVSETDGTLVQTGITDANGQVLLDLNPATYTVSLVKDGVVFSRNNFSCEVKDLTAEDGNNAFELLTEVFSPTVSDPASPGAYATLYLNLFGMDGRPIRRANVTVTLVDPPTILAANTVWDTTRCWTTDSNGYAEMRLLQGVVVDVSITPLSLRRRITVPSGNDAVSPVNLATLLSTADDPFDILNVTVPAAPRRSM